MKKTILLLSSAALMMFAVASCGNKTQTTDSVADSAQAEVVDTATQAAMKKVAGDYKSYDEKVVISLKADGTVETKGSDKYVKWDMAPVSGGEEMYNVTVYKKGIDAPIPTQATINSSEKSLTIKNEVYRIRK